MEMSSVNCSITLDQLSQHLLNRLPSNVLVTQAMFFPLKYWANWKQGCSISVNYLSFQLQWIFASFGWLKDRVQKSLGASDKKNLHCFLSCVYDLWKAEKIMFFSVTFFICKNRCSFKPLNWELLLSIILYQGLLLDIDIIDSDVMCICNSANKKWQQPTV